MFIVRLSDVADPRDPEDTLPTYIGSGCRVMHISLALAFMDSEAACIAASEFPEATMVEVSRADIRRMEPLAAIPETVEPSLAEMIGWKFGAADRRQIILAKWMASLSIPDIRCPQVDFMPVFCFQQDTPLEQALDVPPSPTQPPPTLH